MTEIMCLLSGVALGYYLGPKVKEIAVNLATWWGGPPPPNNVTPI